MKTLPLRAVALFTLLNVADLTLTWFLLDSAETIHEGNPVAAWLLDTYGWLGLTAFKASTMLVGAGLAVVICRRRPGTGQVLLGLCNVILALVVGYSTYLVGCLSLQGEDDLSPTDLRRLEVFNRRMDHERQVNWEYTRRRIQLCNELASRQRRLRDAVAELTTLEKAADPQWLRQLRELYPGYSDAACLAANLMEHTLAQRRQDQQGVQRLLVQLHRDFRTSFGTPPPVLRQHILLEADRARRRS